MKFNLFVIFFIFIFGVSTLEAQIKRYTITGNVVDKEEMPIVGASVVLLNPKDSVMIAYGLTNDLGVFNIKNVKPQSVKLQITYVGFGTIEKIYDIGGDLATVDLGKIVMNGDNLLEEVEITGEFIPIQIKKDTVEYNADAFRVRPNANVEELLKKLPGVEVATDGTVTAQGEQVSRVTVDGKKFFGNDVRMATQNLPADAVKKVQFIDKKSEKAEFTGISDGETEKVMNLQLKDNRKVGTFGEVMAGYGTNNRYEGKASINKFNGSVQIAGLVNSNNLSNQGFSFSDYASLTGGSMFRGGGGSFNIPSVVNQGNNVGRIASTTGGLNFYSEFSPKFNLTTSYFLSHSDQDLKKDVKRQNLLGSRNFNTDELSQTNTNRLGHNINLSIQSKPDTIHRIDLESSIRFNNNNIGKNITQNTFTDKNLFLNNNKQIDSTETSIRDFSIRGVISRRLNKPGRVISLEASLGDNRNNQDYDIESFKSFNNIIDTLLQNQLTRNNTGNYRIFTEYKEPLGKGNYLGISGLYRNNSSFQDKAFYDLSFLTSARSINEQLSNILRNDVNVARLGLNYTKDDEAYSFNAEANFQQSRLKGDSDRPGFVNLNKPFLYFVPSMSLNLRDKNIRIRYNTSVNEPSITQLQPLVDNTDPLNVFQGNPDLKPEYAHNLNLRYNYFDQFNFVNFFAFINVRYTKNKIVNAQNISPQAIRTSKPFNTDNAQSISGNLSYSSPIRPLKLKTRIYTNLSLNKNINFIDNQPNDVTTFSPRAGIDLENTNNEIVSLSVGYDVNYAQNRYSINTAQNTDFIINTLRSVLMVNFGKGFILDGDINHSIYSKTQFGDDNTLTMANAAFSKSIINDRLTFKLRISDIFNAGQGISRNATETFLEQSITNGIGRFTMLSAIYKLSAFNAGKAASQFIISM